MPTSEDASHVSTLLVVIGGIEIDDSSDSTNDWGSPYPCIDALLVVRPPLLPEY